MSYFTLTATWCWLASAWAPTLSSITWDRSLNTSATSASPYPSARATASASRSHVVMAVGCLSLVVVCTNRRLRSYHRLCCAVATHHGLWRSSGSKGWLVVPCERHGMGGGCVHYGRWGCSLWAVGVFIVDGGGVHCGRWGCSLWAAVAVASWMDGCLCRASRYLAMWENLRRAYLYVMTGNQLALVQHHSDVLLSDKQLTTHCFDKRRIFRSTSLKDLDREFTWYDHLSFSLC